MESIDSRARLFHTAAWWLAIQQGGGLMKNMEAKRMPQQDVLRTVGCCVPAVVGKSEYC